MVLLLLKIAYTDAQVATKEIIITRDIEYCKVIDHKKNTQPLLLDIYSLPKKGRTKKPVIFLVHGGGFSSGDKGGHKGLLYPDIAKAFAHHGYVAFSINYRLWPGCPIDSFHIELDNAISDVKAAVNWIKANYKEYSIDTTKIIIGGDSAGGGLAVNASYCNTQIFAGCIDLWGGLPPYGAGNQKQPVNSCPVTAKTPPTCLIHGTKDLTVPYSTSTELAGQLTIAGIYNELHTLEGAGHYPIGKVGADLTIPIIQMMLDFGDKIIKGELSD